MIDHARRTAELHLRESQLKAEAMINEAKLKARDTIEESDTRAREILEEMEGRLRSWLRVIRKCRHFAMICWRISNTLALMY